LRIDLQFVAKPLPLCRDLLGFATDLDGDHMIRHALGEAPQHPLFPRAEGQAGQLSMLLSCRHKNRYLAEVRTDTF
jgi:hypothetical protein